MADGDPIDPNAAAAEAAAANAVDPAVAGGAADPGAAGGTPEPKPAPVGEVVPRKVFLDRVNEETNKRRASEQALTEANKRAADAEALAARLQQAGAKPGEHAAAPMRTEVQPQPQDFQAQVRIEAQRQRIYEDSVEVLNAGSGAFKDFSDSLGILKALNVTNDDFLADLIAVDKLNAHIILDRLAKDPTRAQTLAAMDSRRRTAELTRMAMAEQAKPAAGAAPAAKPASVSRAPAPAPVLEGTQANVVDALTDDKASDQDFSKAWDAKYKTRRTA